MLFNLSRSQITVVDCDEKVGPLPGPVFGEFVRQSELEVSIPTSKIAASGLFSDLLPVHKQARATVR